MKVNESPAFLRYSRIKGVGDEDKMGFAAIIIAALKVLKRIFK